MRSVFGIKHLVTAVLCVGIWIPSALWADCGDILFSNTTDFALARGWKYQAQTNARQAGWNLASARGLGTLDGPGSNWRPVPGELPVQYDDLGLQSLNADSAVWFRCKFILNGRAPDNRAIYLGLIQDTDAVYFNGSLIGETGRPGEEVDIEYPRIYSLPGHMFVDGENLITVRIQGASGNPGFVDTPAIVPEQQKVRALIIRDIPRIVASSIYILVASFFLIFFIFFWHLRENLFFS
ncbi:MAG: hypothetical protein KDK27_07535, partial [Leptospiraceae bacterium]|nr:hypothetical protein [Leptospiraceae bacterium]